MRSLAIVVIVAACDFQPPPRSAPAPAVVTTEADQKTVPADAGADARVPPDAMVVTNNCENIAVHVVNVLIDGTKDPTLKANYEQARTKVVLSLAEACTSQNWSAEAQACYVAAAVEADVRACEKKFPPPAAPRR